MTLRTPRRRISPRTKRRYRAIREFFRRALGTSSQPDIKISSSIAVNVTDLKRKIVGLEQQLDEVNKQCQDIACLDCSRRSESYIESEVNHDIGTIKEQNEGSSERKSNGIDTRVIYKSSECDYRKSEVSDYIPKPEEEIDENQPEGMIDCDEYQTNVTKVSNKKSKLHRITEYGAKLHKYRARSVHENYPTTYSTSSFRSLANPRMNNTNVEYSSPPVVRKHSRQEYTEPTIQHPHKSQKHKDFKRSKFDHFKDSYEQKPSRVRKHKHHNRDLDQDFIADIIRRQYKPVKMFGRKESDLSQFSAPVCRDQEFPVRPDIQEGTELCSCCYDENKQKMKLSDLSEMRSICDTRLYSSKKHTRGKHRRKHLDIFNNSEFYDLVPVKEKSSPKSRRKFTEDNMVPYEYYREVPPSPRSLRPRLNLKAQYNTEFEEYMAHVNHPHRRSSPQKHRHRHERVETMESEFTSDQSPKPIRFIEQPRKTRKHMVCQVEKQELCPQEDCTLSSLQYPPYVSEQVNATVETTFNKTQETEINVDKTDKALCEIKDILQSFLHEIKKETVVSQCDKSDVSSKIGDNGVNTILENNCAKVNSNPMPSRHSFNNYGAGQVNVPPYMTPFTNPCCYPILPMCPMNCPMSMQNGFVMPSQSYTCTNCANSKEPTHSDNCCNKTSNSASGAVHTETCHTETCHTETCHTETEELIKEIYKFVAQGPDRKKDSEGTSDKHECQHHKNMNPKTLTTRSVGESSKLSKHDAKVGTPPLKCYSKSCEAIGCRMIHEPYYSETTNASYSDTLLEKLSLEVTQSISGTELETETTESKSKNNKFSKVLRSIGLFKKKKKDIIEELSESESAIDVDVKPRSPRSPRSPFRQEITNYMMHGQEYYRPPPIPNNYRPNEYQPDYHPPYNPGVHEYQYPPPEPPPIHDIYSFSPRSRQRFQEHATSPSYHSKQRPTAPPYQSTYENHYSQMPQPQVPLCLKEIEVKSIGTQSERKMSIFRKIKKKMQPPPMSPVGGGDDYDQRNCSTQTQTAQTPVLKPALRKPLFNWKNLQAKAMEQAKNGHNDPLKFSLKAQKDLAEGDLKLRNVMLKKMFYKRNPFSPRNLIVRTLLGKDKSSYGEPQTAFRPRMFF